MVTIAKLPKGQIDLTRKVLLELKQVFFFLGTKICVRKFTVKLGIIHNE